MKDMPENYLSILNHLSTVLDNLPEQVVLLGVDGGVYRLLIANAAFAKAMGEHNLAQHPTFEQLLDAAAYRRFQTEAAKTTETHTIQTFRHDESDGSTSCITYLPILDALGEVNGLVLLIFH